MDNALARLGEVGIVPVVRLEDEEAAVPLGRALLAGGIPVAEVTFRTEAALGAIRAMSAALPGLLVGAGTVTRAAQAEAAVAAGARFVVCPAWVDEVVDACLSAGVPVLPGVGGPDGVAKGLAKGLEVLKFFPAEASGGLPMLDALAGPFGGVKFVPTGGVDSGNVGAYARRPNVHAIGGSWMVKPEAVAAGDWAGIERACKEAVSALHGFSFAHLGINGEDEADCARIAERLAALFGFPLKDGSSSCFASDSLEITKRPFKGERGHIGVRCNDVERARAHFREAGVGSLPETERWERGRLKAVYLDLTIGGFAVHLLGA